MTRPAAMLLALALAPAAAAADDWRFAMGQGLLQWRAVSDDGHTVLAVVCDAGNGQLGSAVGIESGAEAHDLGHLSRAYTYDEVPKLVVGLAAPEPDDPGSRDGAVFAEMLDDLAEHDILSVVLPDGGLAVFAIAGPEDGFADCGTGGQ
ncbi:hypothetical protein LNKW23_03580 [Paralimibaculum aggregatum]|uniref:Uncharacterized protein n=1 Tax=Paralimibaculum aggregatum TaxID=3036245 RepID=A0ABQ6LFH7_9RHOB|nr:hypothetical protein [Limibaculum sp. NKW23]GMG81146.1 hypothetical protein LNKW23_03580 [Limibaculum sp. NKW23]